MPFDLLLKKINLKFFKEPTDKICYAYDGVCHLSSFSYLWKLIATKETW